MAIDQEARIRISYRYLRIAPIISVVMLLTAVAIQRTRADCWQTSISAYYFTAAHSAFVATLCAIGVGLIVYKGNSDTEDVILNFAGFFAFIVAMSRVEQRTRQPRQKMGSGHNAGWIRAMKRHPEPSQSWQFTHG